LSSPAIAPGARFENGTEFYRIADLGKVWILAGLYGEEAKAVIPGSSVRLSVRELSKTLYATVSHNTPLFDPASHTLKLRLEADNPRFVLRPDMFVDLELTTQSPAGISVQQDAVIDRGLQKIVYVETSEGVFEPRPVEIGIAYGDRATVTRGLAEGDRVVTAGNFLIDSEKRMRSVAQVISRTEQQPNQHSKEQAAASNYAKHKGGVPLLSTAREAPMINRVISFSVRNKFLVFALVGMACLWGAWAMMHLPLDATPDLSETQVIIVSRWDRSPDIIEDQVTYPIISTMTGAPRVKAVRASPTSGSPMCTWCLMRAPTFIGRGRERWNISQVSRGDCRKA
jgi:hypothetical protein